MKRLFLASSFDDVAHLLPAFAGEDLRDKVVTFIPTANAPQKNNGYILAAKVAFDTLGVQIDELDVSTASTSDIQAKIIQNDYLYVSGGNTFFLLQELKRTGTDRLILEHIKQGKLYIGESAGTIITSPDIAYIAAMDSREKAPLLETTTGLNLVDFYPLPHYQNEPFIAEAQQIIDAYDDKLPLKPISNNQVISIYGDLVSVI